MPLPSTPRRRPYRRGPLLPMSLALACGLVVGAAACGGTSVPAAAPGPAASSSSSAAPLASGSSADATSPGADEACGAALDLTTAALGYPGAGPGEAPPPATALAAWAASLQTPLDRLRATGPSSLDDELTTLAAARQRAATGQPLDLGDPALTAGSAGVEGWIWDSCGLPRVSTANTPEGLVGIPDTLPAGPLSLSFENTGGAAGFVLLVARVNDDVAVTVDDLVADRIDLTTQAQVMVAVSPGPDGQPALASTRLTPGRYAVVSPQGMPPEFTGYHAALITVT